jgi:hypothetical protein
MGGGVKTLEAERGMRSRRKRRRERRSGFKPRLRDAL